MKKNDIGHTSAVIIMNKEGQVLLSKRKVKEGKDMYCLPGGKREKGEKANKAAQRELKEELGIKVNNLKYIETKKKRLSKLWEIMIFYTLLSDKQTTKIKNVEPDKTESIDWFDLDKLPENMWEHNKEYLLESLSRIKELTEKIKNTR
jgi:8-oxo-dGTP diphosphatase